MRKIAATGSLLTAFLLSACGGGGGGLSSTPTPTPTPTTPQANATLSALQVSELFDGRGSYNRFTLGTSGNVISSQGTTSKSMQVRYDATNASYTIVTGDFSDSTFTPSNRSASNSNATLTSYAKTVGSRDEDLVLFNPGTGNPRMALTYTSYGAWQTTITNSSSLDVNTTFFVFGVKTQQSDLPTTGTATYTTTLDGLFAGTTGVYALGGSSSFSANFGSGTVSFTMNPTGTHILNGSSKSFGSIAGNGAISAATNDFGASTSTGGSYSATLNGKFFGPSAAEMGASFVLNGPDGKGTGVIVGKKN